MFFKDICSYNALLALKRNTNLMYRCMKLLKQQVNTETYVYITEKPF